LIILIILMLLIALIVSILPPPPIINGLALHFLAISDLSVASGTKGAAQLAVANSKKLRRSFYLIIWRSGKLPRLRARDVS
jgi:hypothetical protein